MQVAIRILGPGIPAFDFLAGRLIDGQFEAVPDLKPFVEDTFPGISDLIVFDNLLGTSAYLIAKNLGAVTSALVAHPYFLGMEFYPNFIIFKFRPHVKTKEENA